MTPLEQMLAEALAQAVNAESEKFEISRKHEAFYILPRWYQPAVDALETYEEQNRPRVNY